VNRRKFLFIAGTVIAALTAATFRRGLFAIFTKPSSTPPASPINSTTPSQSLTPWHTASAISSQTLSPVPSKTEILQSEPSPNATIRLLGVTIGDFYSKWTNYGAWTREEHLDLIRESGGTAVKLYLNKWAWETNVALPNFSMRYRDRLQQVVGWCRDKLLHVIFEMASGTQDEDHWEAQWQAKADFLMEKSAITKESWIDTCVEICSQMKPDGIGPFNEPPAGKDNYGNTTYLQADLRIAYRKFILSTCEAIHAVSPNTVCYVESCPFWDPRYIIDNHLGLPYVTYEIHPYCVDSVAKKITELFEKKDWEGAKAFYRAYILESTPKGLDLGWSVSKAQRAKLRVYVGECGTNSYQTEWKERIQIHYEVMDEIGLDFIQLALDGNSAFTGPNFYGMLENPWDGKKPIWNELGLLWQQNALAKKK
jgi:hypothetical protein